MTEDAGLSLDAGARAALGAGKPIVYVGPPAAWTLAPVLAALPAPEGGGLRLLVLAPTPGDAFDAGRAARRLPGFEPVHVCTATPRTSRLLAGGAVRTLVATPEDCHRLLEQSALKAADTRAVLLLWPATVLAATGAGLLDAILAETRGTLRIVAVTDEHEVADFIERHARRAPLAVADRPPTEPSVACRYAVVDEDRRVSAARTVLDAVNPAATLLWDPAGDRIERWAEFGEDPTVTVAGEPPAERRFDLALAVDLPTAPVLSRLAAQAGQVVVFLRPGQIGWLERVARQPRAFRLAGAVDRARERAHALRQRVRERLDGGGLSAELLALAPLFDEYDPALVAAALAWPDAAPAAPITAWVRLQVGVGRRDRVRPADLAGALLNGVGLARESVGRIDIKEGVSIVEVRLEDAPRAMEGLAGLSVRGRPLAARAL